MHYIEGAIARRRQEALRTRPLIMFTISLSKKYDILHGAYGGMAEWLKAAVLKTVEPQGSVGSNPTSSARSSKAPEMGLFSCPAESGRRGRRIRTGRSCAARGTCPQACSQAHARRRLRQGPRALAEGGRGNPTSSARLPQAPEMGLFSCPAEPGRRGRRIRTGRSCAARGTCPHCGHAKTPSSGAFASSSHYSTLTRVGTKSVPRGHAFAARQPRRTRWVLRPTRPRRAACAADRACSCRSTPRHLLG